MASLRGYLNNLRNNITSHTRDPGSASGDVEQPRAAREEEYKIRFTLKHFKRSLLAKPDDPMWTLQVCSLVLLALVLTAMDLSEVTHYVDDMYNLTYAMHAAILWYSFYCDPVAVLDCRMIIGLLIEIATFSHYIVNDDKKYTCKLICYYTRVIKTFTYLWTLNNYNMKGSVLDTALKYFYVFLVIRVTWVILWLNVGEVDTRCRNDTRRAMIVMERNQQEPGEYERSENEVATRFISAVYIVNKMFIPVGPAVAPRNDFERIACLLVMITGSLVVTGAAVASLSLVISVYMRPEESFRTRYRLIMKEITVSNVPPSLRDKVETFYKMYWHKQRAVSATQLLPIFPPSLSTTIYTDIYFKATQRCRILRDLSYEFLSEVAKKMETVHYIPGDAIIKRNDKKSSIIYITYGDIEMLTAEDDSTAMLRMIRGTILSPLGGCPVAGCGRAHVEIRAATFCTAHVLRPVDLWKTVLKYGKENGQGATVLGSFYLRVHGLCNWTEISTNQNYIVEHFERVRRHYFLRFPEEAKFKSSILHFKRNLMELKESRDAAGNQQLAHTDVMIDIAGCYIMRNRADASLKDEADAICLRPTFPCILQPKSSLQVVWNLFVSCLIITVCITHPYYLVYKKHVPVEFRFYDYFVTVIYILDLIVHLSTGANVEDGVPITLAQTSSQQARSSWFVLDVIGTLPIFEFMRDGHFAGLNKLLRLPKVFRMLKTVEDECVYHSNVLRFISFSLLLVIACYLLAALQQGFMCYSFGYCLVSNFTHTPFWEKKSLDEETVESRITFGLYWAISMVTFTTHMETWGMKNWNYVLYTMFVLEICTVLYIFIEAMYSATIMVTTALREDHDSCIENVMSFLVRNDVDPILRNRFQEYLQLSWYTDKGYSMTNKKRSIFYDLPPHVYQDIVARQRSKFILCVPFMKLLHKEDLKNISSKAILFCTSPNEILMNTGDMCNEIYIIKRGICEILSPVTKDVVSELTVRSHFGVLECLLRLPAFYTVRAVTHVEIFTISRKHLVNAINVPQIKEALEYCKEQPQYTSLQVRREPFIAYQPPEPPPNMWKFRYPRKYEHDVAFLHPFYRLGIFSALRYIFPRFTIRPDGHYLVRLEWFRATCAVLSAMVYPGYSYLVLQWPWLYFIALLLDFTAYFDILQRMLVGYYNEHGILVYHPVSTAARYLRGAFLVDLLGCLPLERLESSWKESIQGRYREAPTKQFLMLNRLLQLYRTHSALMGLSGLIRRDILLVISSFPLLLALVNILTCFMVYASAHIYFTTSGEDDPWYIVPFEDKGGSWIHLFASAYRFNLTESPWNLHLGSMFWVVYETTTTGYNSFKPSNFNLMRVLITGMIIGAIITTYYSVRIISVRANVNKALASFQEHLKDISVFMKNENLDPQLQKQVKDYYKYNWDKMGGVDYRKVLKLCAQITLRTDAILHIYGPTFTKCPILNQCDVSLLRIIGRAVRSFYFLKDTTIIEEDDVVADIYFIDRGSVELKEKGEDDNYITLTKGSMFGNLEGASTIRCPVSMKTTSQVHLLQINSQAFFSIISEFPVVLKLLNSYRPTNENYIAAASSVSCINLKDRSTTSTLLLHGQKIIKYFSVRQSIIRIYLITVCLACIYADMYNVGFQDNGPIMILFLYLLDFCFLLKFTFQYILPQKIDEDDALKTLIKTRDSYMKHELKYDLLSFVPIEALCLLSRTDRGMLFSWLRLNRMFRIVTIYKCLQQHSNSIAMTLSVSTAVTVLVWFPLFVHGCTCLWRFIAAVEEVHRPKSSWIYDDEGKPWCENYYICSMYFILTTFTQNGVGDILPKLQTEVAFVSILQVVSIMIYMVYVGELCNIIQYKSFRSFNFYSKHLELQEFLKNNRVSQKLVAVVNKYSLHLWRASRGLQLPLFLSTAPNCLMLQVMAAAYLKHLANNLLFKECEPAFLRQLVGVMKLYTYTEDMYVAKEGEITESMYFVHTGRVRETCGKSKIIRSYRAGENFGQLQGLIHDLPYSHTYVTAIKSQILTLHLKDWEDILKHFPNSKKAIYKHVAYIDDDDSYGDDSKPKGPKVYSSKSDKPPSSPKGSSKDPLTSTRHSTSSIQTDSPVKVKSGIFVPPPGPGETYIRSQSVDKPYMWPTDSKHSSSSLLRASTVTSQPERNTSVAPTITLDEGNRKHLSLHSSHNIKDIDSIKSIVKKSSLENIPAGSSKGAFSTVEHEFYHDEEKTFEEENPKVDNYKSNELKSVEDYIQDQQGDEKISPNKFEEKSPLKSSTDRFKRIMPTLGFKKRKAHVRYEEETPPPHPTRALELKPIRDRSADEKNLKSLDSDMETKPKSDDNVTISSSESDSSIKRNKKSHDKD